MKGCEENLYANLESFFRLKHSNYELLFSVAEAQDPAIAVIEDLMGKWPDARARLIVGEIRVGLNPKVNNLIRSYSEARYDNLLISDSNVRVGPGYLRDLLQAFDRDVGVVTAIVAGVQPQGWGGWLEANFLNTFYARWMLLSRYFAHPVVVGKSMLFRRPEMNRIGGLRNLAGYLAEDYMAGLAMLFLGKKIGLMRTPIEQPIGRYSFSAFWSRHLRWGRIRKSQSPLAFAFEPCLSLFFSGGVGALAAQGLWQIPVLVFLSVHVALWLFCDLVMMSIVAEKPRLRAVLAWGLREALYLPLWFHIACGCRVNWRGNQLVIGRGGMLKTKGI